MKRERPGKRRGPITLLFDWFQADPYLFAALPLILLGPVLILLAVLMPLLFPDVRE